MAKKKQPDAPKRMDPHVQGLRAEVMEQPICQTLEQNYMPYAMSVIVSRAILAYRQVRRKYSFSHT